MSASPAMNNHAPPPPSAAARHPSTTFRARGIACTRRLGTALGARLRPGDLVSLRGDLGAGKTLLARAMLRAALNAPRLEVPSPTFTLVQTYESAKLELWHVDLYRLTMAGEVIELGLDDALARGAALIVEWPERMGTTPLPARARLDITMGFAPDTGAAAAYDNDDNDDDERTILLAPDRGWQARLQAAYDACA